MSSVMHYAMDALPMAAVGHNLATSKNHKDRELAYLQASADELRRLIEFVPMRISKQMEPVRVEHARSAYRSGRRPPIWAFESGPHPDRVGLGAVRVKEMGLAAHVVFEQIQWGRALENRKVVPQVLVTLWDGQKLALPLEDRFLYSQWWTRFPIDLPENAVPLHPLENPLNVGLVRSFLFVQLTDREVFPLDESPITDEESDEWRITDTAMRQLELGSAWQDPKLGEKLFRHKALARGADAEISGVIGGDTVRVRGVGNRFLVTISLFLGRDVYDFEPAGALAAARVHPHLHFVSTTKCQRVEAACRVVRPRKTRILDEYGQEPMESHAVCGQMHSEIRSLLVADTNEQNLLVWDVPVEVDLKLGAAPTISNFNPPPHWGNLFSYYAVDAAEQFPGRAYRMVHQAGLRGERRAYDAVVREPPHLVVPVPERDNIEVRKRLTHKVARQGEFDNFHIAPRMFLDADHARYDRGRGAYNDWHAIDRTAYRLTDIAMAPLCAHDCFHCHWRWSDNFSRSSVFGWDAVGPYRAAGAPLIPLNHQLDLMLPAHHDIIFSETANQIEPGRQEVLFHFGASYGLAADGIRALLTPKQTTGAIHGAPWQFGVTKATAVEPVDSDSWANMYWNFRYFLKEEALPPPSMANNWRTGVVLDMEEYHDVRDLLRAMEL